MTGSTWILEGGKGGLSSPTQYERGFSKLTANEGGRYHKGDSSKFHCDTNKILQPLPSPPLVIELRFVQFWSEIILMISNHAYAYISDQIALHLARLP